MNDESLRHGVACPVSDIGTHGSPLVIISCTSTKSAAAGLVPAVDRYGVSSTFRLAVRAARAVTCDCAILVISARYGLLGLHSPIPDYQMSLTDPRAVTADLIAAQAARAGLAQCREVLVLAPAAYANLTCRIWPEAHRVFAGTRGIGDQRHLLTVIAAEGLGGLPARTRATVGGTPADVVDPDVPEQRRTEGWGVHRGNAG